MCSNKPPRQNNLDSQALHRHKEPQQNSPNCAVNFDAAPKDSINIYWADVIVLFNSLIKNIDCLRNEIDSGALEEDDLYDTEEELNDYLTVIARLRDKFHELEDKGDLPENLLQKLKQIC